MSIAGKAARGAAWMFAGGAASQIVGFIGTLVMLRFVSPSDYGAVIGAVVLLGTAAQFASLGLGQYVIVRTRGRPDLTFHAALYQGVVGAVAIAIVLFMRERMALWMRAPGLTTYLPWMASSVLIDRWVAVPERMLLRDMRFRPYAAVRAAGDFTYVAVSLMLVVAHVGGMALVVGNIARSVVRATILLRLVERKAWLDPCPLSWTKTRELFAFGVPVSIGGLASYASRRWDNLLVTHALGPVVLASYNLAYSLAEIVGALVGEQAVDVLVPSFVRIDEGSRGRALHRAMELVALLTVPLEVGLGAVSTTLVGTLLDARYAMVGPMLAVLSVMAVAKSPSALTSALLQATGRSRSVMWLDVLGAVATLSGVAVLGQFGPLWMCVGVGLAALIRAVASVLIAGTGMRASAAGLLSGQTLPIVASVPMVGAVLLTRWALGRADVSIRGVNLTLEVIAGAATYACAVVLFARSTAHELLHLMRGALVRRKAQSVA